MRGEKTEFIVNSQILNNYVAAINFSNEPMSEIKKKIKKIANNGGEKIEHDKNVQEDVSNVMKPLDESSIWDIITMIQVVKEMIENNPKKKNKVFTEIIRQIMTTNNGIISTRMIEPLNISRQYISAMEGNNEIEKISRGIYVSSKAIDDSYYSFQQKYKKTIFSHMNALYFYGMTEEFPYSYTVTVPHSYHDNKVNEKCNVFYANNDIYELGVCEVETPNGNKVKAYDIERCICDIIKSKNRMDFEQIKKTIKLYVNSENKNILKLSEYSTKMGINKQVMTLVGMYND